MAAQRSPECLRAALTLTPEDASKWTRLGVALLPQHAGASEPAFRRAIALNPYEVDALAGLAILEEARQNFAGAESLYKQATMSSRRFRPAFALAAFYARAKRFPEFRKAAATAAAIDHADIDPIVYLARDAGLHPRWIAPALDLHTEHALVTFLRIATKERWLASVAEVAMKVPSSKDGLHALAGACDRLIEEGMAEPAVRVWNRIGAFSILDIAEGRSLSNPRFAPGSARGFNWRTFTQKGVELRFGSTGLQLELSGDQPEHALLLEQIVPLLPERRYRLTMDGDAEAMPRTAGLAWKAQCVSSAAALAAVPLANSPASVTILEFVTPSGCNLARLMLTYDRQLGTVRVEGTLDLKRARLELLP